MSQEFNPLKLDLQAFANAGAMLQDMHDIEVFPRLSQELPRPELGHHEDYFVQWAVAGTLEQGPDGSPQVWLHLKLRACFPMTCQRCLDIVGIPISFDHSYRFVATEEQADLEDEESIEDVLAFTQHFNILELVEDEVLMALPLLPTHDTCPKPLKTEVLDKDFAEPEKKPNPFSVLQGLKTKS